MLIDPNLVHMLKTVDNEGCLMPSYVGTPHEHAARGAGLVGDCVTSNGRKWVALTRAGWDMRHSVAGQTTVIVYHVLSKTCGEQIFKGDSARDDAIVNAFDLAVRGSMRVGEPVTIWTTLEIEEKNNG